MAKVKFYLKEANSDKESLILLYFLYNGKRLKYSTGEFIHPDYWHSGDQRAKSSMPNDEADEFNSRLDILESDIKKVYRRISNDGMTPTNSNIKAELEKERGNVKKEKVTLFLFIDTFIEESKKLKAPATIKAYNNTRNHLKKFKQKRRRNFDFEDIDLNFYNSFTAYLSNDLGFANNTIGNQIKNLKLFMNEATERGLNTNLDFQKTKFKKVTENADKIYLNTKELKKMYDLDLSENKRLEKVRDLFLVGCYTGLRFSDFIQVKKENIVDGNKIKIRTQKTSETVVIPLHPYVKEVFEKYDGDLPKPASNQKMNEYLKEVGKKAKIKDKVEISITKGGKLQKDIYRKYNLISTHVARRSFATNLYLADVPSITIMKITGHKTEKSFLRYIRISQEENANKLLNHPFFNS